jgi:Tat protein secretion system quality control protein TatD with DNase activity
MLFDAHTHAQNIVSPAEDLLHETIGGIVVCATSPDDWQKVADTVRRFNIEYRGKCVLGFGLHPWYVGPYFSSSTISPEEYVDMLSDKLEEYRGVLHHVGEIGIDKSPKALDKSSWEIQLKVFELQLVLSLRLKLACTIHCVRSHNDLVEILEKVFTSTDSDVARLLLHSYSGSYQSYKRIKKFSRGNRHIFFSLVGSSVVPSVAYSIFQKNDDMKRNISKDLLKILTDGDILNHLCLETDAPDQSFPSFSTYPVPFQILAKCVCESIVTTCDSDSETNHSSNRTWIIYASVAIWRGYSLAGGPKHSVPSVAHDDTLFDVSKPLVDQATLFSELYGIDMEVVQKCKSELSQLLPLIERNWNIMFT